MFTTSPQSTVGSSAGKIPQQPTSWKMLAGLLLVTVLIRGGAMGLLQQNLTVDVDAYLGIARTVAAGDGYSSPGTRNPTAFRPPLYPLLLAAGLSVLPEAMAVACINLFSACLAVLLLERIGRQSQLSLPCRVAAVLVLICDPLLIYYGTFPMTETCAATLATALVWMIGRRGTGWGFGLLLGVLFGLAGLCRPTFWAFFGFWLIWRLLWWFRRPQPIDSAQQAAQQGPRFLLAVSAGALLTILPWILRNHLEFGRPLALTTHGGYTLLLANNSVFQTEVLDTPGQPAWSGQSLANWQNHLEREMEQAGIATGDEVARDQWMKQRAWSYIRNHPRKFLKLAWLRFQRFWGTTPPESALKALAERLQSSGVRADLAKSSTRLMSSAVSGFYWFLFFLAVFGIGVEHRQRTPCRQAVLSATLLLIVAFATVHLFYWSNARMRGPVMPAIAVLAAIGLSGLQHLWRNRSSTTQDSNSHG